MWLYLTLKRWLSANTARIESEVGYFSEINVKGLKLKNKIQLEGPYVESNEKSGLYLGLNSTKILSSFVASESGILIIKRKYHMSSGFNTTTIIIPNLFKIKLKIKCVRGISSHFQFRAWVSP